MKEILAVYDRDARYAETLCKRLNAAEDFPYAAVCFRTKTELLNYSGQGTIGMLLIDRIAEDEDIRRMEAGPVLYLTDVQGYPWVDNVPTVYRYQSVHQIEAEIRKRSGMQGYMIAESPLFRTRYVGICSPVGRSMKTGFALTLGQILSQSSKVLYLNFELCSGFSAFFEHPFDFSFSDVLYEMETKPENCRLKQFVTEYHGMDCIAPVRNPEDLYETDPEKILRAVTALSREGTYDIVLMDLGTDFRIIGKLLKLCGTVYIPTRRDAAAEEKVHQFREWIRQKEGDKLLDRCIELVLPGNRMFTGSAPYTEQLLFSEMGDFVRNLLED